MAARTCFVTSTAQFSVPVLVLLSACSKRLVFLEYNTDYGLKKKIFLKLYKIQLQKMQNNSFNLSKNIPDIFALRFKLNEPSQVWFSTLEKQIFKKQNIKVKNTD